MKVTVIKVKGDDELWQLVDLVDRKYVGYNLVKDEIREFDNPDIIEFHEVDSEVIEKMCFYHKNSLSKLQAWKFMYGKKIPEEAAKLTGLDPNMDLKDFFQWFYKEYNINGTIGHEPDSKRSLKVNGVRQGIFDNFYECYQCYLDLMLETLRTGKLAFKLTE